MNSITIPACFGCEDTQSLYVYDYRLKNSAIQNQVNLTQHVFSFLIEGKKEVMTSLTPIAIDNASFLLISKGNCIMTEKLSLLLKKYRSVLFFFSDEMLLKLAQQYNIYGNPKIYSKPVMSFVYDAYIKDFVSSLTHISQLKKPLQNKLLSLKFEEIMLYLIEKKGEGFLQSLISCQDNNARKLNSVVENNKYNKLTIKELSFLCNMSISTFKRMFERQYCCSPKRWFQEKRLEYAAYMLRIQSKRPTDLFYMVGYESLSHFTQAFKKKYGVTPKQFQSK